MTAFIVVFKDDKGKYYPNFCTSESVHTANVKLGNELRYEIVYENNFRNYGPCMVVEKFIREANKVGKFDKKALEALLGEQT